MAIARYFSITKGLAGCYLPDDAYVIKVTTRRDLKEAIEAEAELIRCDYEGKVVGLARGDVAGMAADLWEKAKRKRTDGSALHWGPRGQSRSMSLAVTPATRQDYDAYLAVEG